MNKLNKNVVAVVVGVLLLSAGVAQAVGGFSWSGVQKETAQILASQVQAPSLDEEQKLGAGLDPNNMPDLQCTASGDCSKIVVVQSFVAQSSTFISVPSPFLKATTTGASEVVIFTDDGGKKYTSATATVDLVRINITGAATTSYHFGCAASAGTAGVLPFHNPIVTTTPTIAGYIATSSIGLVENNLSQAQGAVANGGSVDKITVNSALPYLVCTAEASEAAGLTNADETFNGKAVLRFNLTRL